MLGQTALISEILVVGVQAAIWSAMLVSWSPLEIPWGTEAGGVVAATLAVALVYTLGVVVDRLADSTLGTFRKTPGGHAKESSRKRLTILHRSEGMANFLEYIRSRIRIARATTFNAALLAVLLAARLAWCGAAGCAFAQHERFLLVAAALAAPAAFFALRRIEDTYDRHLDGMYNVLAQDGPKAS